MTTISTRVGNLVLPRLSEAEILPTSHSGTNSISIIALEGLNCGGVPTRTTPTITPVTPTTLCQNLDEQTLLTAFPLGSESHHNAAGFVPPLVQSMTSDSSSTSATTSYTDSIGGGIHMNVVDTKIWQGASSTTINDLPPLLQNMSSNNHPSSVSPPIPPHVMSIGGSSCSSSSSSSSGSGRKNIGGRRPNKENGISPEEEHRRNLRRERNKQAAARCRKRRLDHTNQLLLETEDLEKKRQHLTDEVVWVRGEVAKLKELLNKHDCKIPSALDSPEDVKPFVLNPELSQIMANEKQIKIEPRNFSSEECITPHLNNSPHSPTSIVSMTGSKQRPNFLPVSNSSFLTKTLGVPISTPSTEFMDAFLQEGGTGLTPITSALVNASCSTQLRSLNGMDLSSPDSNVKKLVSL